MDRTPLEWRRAISYDKREKAMEPMTDREHPGPPRTKAGAGEQDARAARLAAALRANLARRKAQSRARVAAGEIDAAAPPSEKD
jgi:hypothetical protein